MSKIIVIEGPDGAGKSTIAKGLVERLSIEGYTCADLHSPGATEVGKEIASLIYSEGPSRKSMSFLYMADFAHLNDWLKNETTYDYIIMDRHSCFSELVYSGMIENKETAQFMHDIYFKYMGCDVPSYSIILNIPYDIACSRIVGASRFNNFLDSKFVSDEEWGNKIVNRYSALKDFGCVLADTSNNRSMWLDRTPDDWVEDLYTRMAALALV